MTTVLDHSTECTGTDTAENIESNDFQALVSKANPVARFVLPEDEAKRTIYSKHNASIIRSKFTNAKLRLSTTVP